MSNKKKEIMGDLKNIMFQCDKESLDINALIHIIKNKSSYQNESKLNRISID